MYSYQTALEIIADRPVSSAEIDERTMGDLACESDSGQYYLAGPCSRSSLVGSLRLSV
jgi:hypothetical protein